MQERKKPTYALGRVKMLVLTKRYRISGRARRFIKNRYDAAQVTSVVREVFLLIDASHFGKSVPLEVMPGCWADVYRGINAWDGTWYVKFAVEEASPLLNVLSLNWDGFIH